MNSKVFLISWDSVYDTVLYTESQLISNNISYIVFDSGTVKEPRENWIHIGDIRFYGQLYESLKFAVANDYDYITFILGDVTTDKLASVLQSAEYVFTNMNVGVYAPYFTNSPWGKEQTLLEDINATLSIATQTDGLLISFTNSVFTSLYHYMKQLDTKIGLHTLRTGWGMDYIWCALCVLQGKFIVRDSSIIVNHPHGSSYDHGLASHEMTLVMNTFLEMYANPEVVGSIFTNIQRRMGGDREITAFYFYQHSRLYRERQDVPKYHIINISADRNYKVEHIRSSVDSEQLPVKSVNAYNLEDSNEFFNATSSEIKVSNFFKRGEFGCFASHYLFWKYVIDHKLENALVFEDDCTVHANFSERCTELLARVPLDYDVFSVFVHSNQAERFTQAHKINPFIALGYQDWSTLCYVVSYKGALRLCQLVEEYGMSEPVDWFIFRKGHAKLLNVYTLTPQVAHLVDIDTACRPSIDRSIQ